MVTHRIPVDRADWERSWGLLSDPHGNPFGLLTALQMLEENGAERFFCLGDVVGYMPFAHETLQLLRANRVACISGNHDAMVTGKLPLDVARDEVYGIAKTRATLDERELAEIGSWPQQMTLMGPDGRSVHLVHGGISDCWAEYVYPDSDLTAYASSGHHFVFVGHTHRPFIAKAGKCTVVNVGSCGLPRDIGDCVSGALFSPSSGAVRLLRRRFDTAALLEKAAKPSVIHPSVIACFQRR